MFITHATLNQDKVDSKRTQTEVAYNLLKMVKGKEEDIVEDMIDNIKIKDDIGNDDRLINFSSNSKLQLKTANSYLMWHYNFIPLTFVLRPILCWGLRIFFCTGWWWMGILCWTGCWTRGTGPRGTWTEIGPLGVVRGTWAGMGSWGCVWGNASVWTGSLLICRLSSSLSAGSSENASFMTLVTSWDNWADIAGFTCN